MRTKHQINVTKFKKNEGLNWTKVSK